MSLFGQAQDAERKIKGILRTVDMEAVSREDKERLQKLKSACAEIKLDIRDYEYAETREQQLKWKTISCYNIDIVQKMLLDLGDYFQPADTAHMSANYDSIKTNLQ